MKAIVHALNQEKALVGTFSVIVKSLRTFALPSVHRFKLYLRASASVARSPFYPGTNLIEAFQETVCGNKGSGGRRKEINY